MASRSAGTVRGWFSDDAVSVRLLPSGSRVEQWDRNPVQSSVLVIKGPSLSRPEITVMGIAVCSLTEAGIWPKMETKVVRKAV